VTERCCLLCFWSGQQEVEAGVVGEGWAAILPQTAAFDVGVAHVEGLVPPDVRKVVPAELVLLAGWQQGLTRRQLD
jgi:hypothetical protein